jgi:2-desacetyl-2-hydroxyethyl bacteriochlorophyllide A dehydrogenase
VKALIYEGPRQMTLHEVEMPRLSAGDVLIEVAYSGICGSELSGFLGESSLRQPPLIFGHEFSGRIVQRGSQAQTYAVGTRVTANPLISCGQCHYCTQSQEQLCVHRRLLGAALAGSNAAYVAVPEGSVVALPDTVTFEQATLAEPVAYALHVAQKAQFSESDTLVVYGMGPIGLFVLQAARHYGVRRIYAVDTNSERLAMAEALGATQILNPVNIDVPQFLADSTNGLKASVAVDAVGNAITRKNAVISVRAGGTVIFSGLHSAETALPINDMIRNEVTTAGAFAYTAAQFRSAVDLVAQGVIGLHDEWIIKAPLEDGRQWFETLLGNAGSVAKVLLVPQ